MDKYTQISKIHQDIAQLDKDTGNRLKLIKAYYMRGMVSVLDNGMLISAIADINLETAALMIAAQYDDLSLATMNARESGQKYAHKWKDG